MWIGWIELDFLLGDVHSLKEKRSVIRPVISSVVAGDLDHVTDILDRVERMAASRPELHLVAVRRRTLKSDDI